MDDNEEMRKLTKEEKLALFAKIPKVEIFRKGYFEHYPNDLDDKIPKLVSDVVCFLVESFPEKYPDVGYDYLEMPMEKPQSLGLIVWAVSFNKSSRIEEYFFEPDSVNGENPDLSVIVRYNPKTDKIINIIFRFYGENRSRFVEISAKIHSFPVHSYGSSESNDTWFDFDDIPNHVLARYDGTDLFRWDNGLRAINVLDKALGIGVHTVRKILGYFLEQREETPYITSDGETVNEEKTVSHVKRDTVLDFIRKMAGLSGVSCPKQKSNNADTKRSDTDTKHSSADTEYSAAIKKYADLINDPDNNYFVEPKLLMSIMNELVIWLNKYEKMKDYELSSKEYQSFLENEEIPNLVFMGDPGTGKTVLAKRLAENVLGAAFYPITGVGLKDNWIGHTSSMVVDKFIKLREMAGDDKRPAVLFIDEAYNLFNNKDSFSADSIEVLLKAMEQGMRTLKAKLPKRNAEDKAVEITLYGNTAVWLGGYEKDMRKAISANSGMYRRTVPIVLPRPDIDSLERNFFEMLSRKSDNLDAEISEENIKVCNRQRELIHSYFAWARSKTYAEFFGNYAGVRKLVKEIEKFSLLFGRALAEEPYNDLNDIIERLKLEIRTQYLQVIEEKFDRLPFTVYTDVKEAFKDYIGAESAKEKLNHVIEMICSPENYLNCASPKGALLVGAPGTGKTFLARCMAGELSKKIREKDLHKDVAFIQVASTELRTNELVKALFSSSEGYDNAIVFIDEIDAIGKKRTTNLDDSVLIQLLNEMDGFEAKKNIFVLAATNAPELLDAALTRPGRFDMKIEVGYPNSEDRHKLVEHYISKLGIANNSKEAADLINRIADTLCGYSPIEIKTILNETLILYRDCENKIPSAKEIQAWFAHRITKGDSSAVNGIKTVKIKSQNVMVSDGEKDRINYDLFLIDLDEAAAQRSVGERSKPGNSDKNFSIEKNDNSLSSTAIHEVGHALVSVLHDQRFEKITILKRGDFLGYVQNSADTTLVTKQDYLNRIDICFGGRAAEELIYGADYISGSASQDIRQASNIAREMIMEYGMNEKVGPMALEMPSYKYLGGYNMVICSESTISFAEDEVRKLLKERYSATLEMLRSHAPNHIAKLAEQIHKKEEASYDEFVGWWDDILGGGDR